jgi:hypothetical protein
MKLETYCTFALVAWIIVTSVILAENIAAALCR